MIKEQLLNLLKSNKFDEKYLFEYSTHKDIFIKEIEIPDKIYFDNNVIIIFKCIKNNNYITNTLIKNYFKYINNKYLKFNIYGVEFISSINYSILKLSIKNNKRSYKIISNKNIKLETFNIKPVINMKLEIKKIHDYIYENTKILNEDKSLFIAIILIGLKNNLLVNIINDVISQDDVYTLLETILSTFNLNVDIFKYLQYDKNKEHLYNIIHMVNEVYIKSPSIDLLNEFYSEFIKYGNNDSKSLGIVLTPPHIVSIMVKMLNINKKDIVLDLCTGTGSFLIESIKYNPKQIIGCEFQLKLFNLLKCNMIIRDINNYDIFNNDCFNLNFKATKSIINPPYATNSNEWEFIEKQLDSIENGGECCAIIPNSVLNDSTNNVIYKTKILEKAHIISIIFCRNTLFYPVANIATSIIHLRKEVKLNNKTKLIDYRDDGFISKRTCGFIKDDTFDKKLNLLYNKLNNKITNNEVILTPTINWYQLSINTITTINKFELRSSLEQITYFENLLNLELLNLSNQDISQMTIVDVNTYFEILTKPNIEYIKNNKVFSITAKNNNNGIKKITDSNNNTFIGNKLTVITTGDGGAGMCYYQSKDFNITSAVKVLQPRDNIKLNKYIGIFIATQLSKNKFIYNRGNTWKVDLIKSAKFVLPIINNEIDYECITNLFI